MNDTAEPFDEAPESGWVCPCGNYQDGELHCDNCGAAPPWGCDCSFCYEDEDEDRELDHMTWEDDWDEQWSPDSSYGD